MFSCTQKALVNYERHLSDIRKIPTLKKFTTIYQKLEATMYFSLCDMETHVQWVGGFLVQHQTHTVLLVIGFSWIQDSAFQVTEHLKARNKTHSKWSLNPTMTTETLIPVNLTFGITLWWGQQAWTWPSQMHLAFNCKHDWLYLRSVLST